MFGACQRKTDRVLKSAKFYLLKPLVRGALPRSNYRMWDPLSEPYLGLINQWAQHGRLHCLFHVCALFRREDCQTNVSFISPGSNEIVFKDIGEEAE